ncbi:MAG: hypothetical protein RL739_51 [Pseudomonadota bacterium]
MAAQVLAAALLVVQPVAVQLLVVAQPQAVQVLQPVVPALRRAVQLQPVVRPQQVPVQPLRRAQRRLQLQPRWVWWQPVWLRRLWLPLQRPRRMMLHLPLLRIPPTAPTPIKFLTHFSSAPLGRFFIPVNLHFHF